MIPVSHPPYSPDLTLYDFCVCFVDIDELKKKTTETLPGIKEDELKEWFDQWNKRLDKCITNNGESFED